MGSIGRLRWQMASNLAAYQRGLAQATARSFGTLRGVDVQLTNSSPSVPFLNRATLLRPLDRSETSRTYDLCYGFFGGSAGNSFMIDSFWPNVDFSPFGCRLSGSATAMLRLPGVSYRTPPLELQIFEVVKTSDFRRFEEVFIGGYPVPELQETMHGTLFAPVGGSRFWLGLVDGSPVTCANSFTSHGITGVFNVTTIPSARGRGYGTAISWAATQADPALPAVLQAAQSVRSVFEGLGFVPTSDFHSWI